MERFYKKNIRATADVIQQCGGRVGVLLTEEVIDFVENIERNGYEIKFSKITKETQND